MFANTNQPFVIDTCNLLRPDWSSVSAKKAGGVLRLRTHLWLKVRLWGILGLVTKFTHISHVSESAWWLLFYVTQTGESFVSSCPKSKRWNNDNVSFWVYHIFHKQILTFGFHLYVQILYFNSINLSVLATTGLWMNNWIPQKTDIMFLCCFSPWYYYHYYITWRLRSTMSTRRRKNLKKRRGKNSGFTIMVELDHILTITSLLFDETDRGQCAKNNALFFLVCWKLELILF